MTRSKHTIFHLTGIEHSKETKRKQSEIKQGKNHPFYGKHLSDGHKLKLSKAKQRKNHPHERECSCEKCIGACWRNPGWFGYIGEIEGVAKIMKVSTKDFAKEYLIQEWWAGDEDIYIPAPRRNFDKRKDRTYRGLAEGVQQNGKGFVVASWGHNLMQGWACIFLDDNNRCLIHQSKPEECRETFSCEKFFSNFKGREKLVSYWKKHQDYIDFLKS